MELLGPEKGDCGCGCGAFGRLKKPSRDGTRCVSRACKCKRCTGRNNNKRGHAKQVRAARALGIPVGSLMPSNEESYGGPVRVEVKSGHKAGPVRTAYERERAQSEQHRPIGDTRTFVAAYAPDGTSRMYYVIRDDDLDQFVAALAESWGAA